MTKIVVEEFICKGQPHGKTENGPTIVKGGGATVKDAVYPRETVERLFFLFV